MKLVNGPLVIQMKKSFISAEENLKVNFHIVSLHVLYAFQPKGSKEEVLEKGDEVPEFIEKKVKSAG